MTHLRAGMSYMSICGLGYYWPSTISLTPYLDEVDCRQCLSIVDRVRNLEASGNVRVE